MKAELKGLITFKAKLENIRSNIIDGIDGELEAAAENIELYAKQNVPDTAGIAGGGKIDFAGQIRNSFYLDNQPLRKEIGVRNINNKPYPAWIEFGTGIYVSIPEGLEDYAMTFYVNGKGKILPHPFLFPAVERERVELIKRIKELLGA